MYYFIYSYVYLLTCYRKEAKKEEEREIKTSNVSKMFRGEQLWC